MLQEEAAKNPQAEARRRAANHHLLTSSDRARPKWPLPIVPVRNEQEKLLTPMRSYRQDRSPNLVELSALARRPALHSGQGGTARQSSPTRTPPNPANGQLAEASAVQHGRPEFCSSPLYKALQMGVDLGSFAADAGGAMMAAELMFGEPGLGGAPVEAVGSGVATAASFGQALMGDQRAIERTIRNQMNRGILRVVPKKFKSDFADYLFEKATDSAIPSVTQPPC